MALPDEGTEKASLNPVTLQDIFTRLGHVEQGQVEIHEELCALTTEVRTGLNGGKTSLRDRVVSLEGRWNRLVGGGVLLVVLLSAWEVVRFLM